MWIDKFEELLEGILEGLKARKKIAPLQDEVKNLQRELDAANDTANFYRDTYKELEEIYKLYLNFDDDTRHNLAGIFGAGNTATEFLSGAVQESHIHSLWDYIARHNSDTLQKIFDFAFKMYNKGFRDAPYTRLEISQGFEYDDEFMSRTPSSSQMGNVSRVLFQGYRYSTGKVIKKSIVELG